MHAGQLQSASLILNVVDILEFAGPVLLAGLGVSPFLAETAQAEIETNKSVISVRGLSAFQRSAQRNYLAVGHLEAYCPHMN